MPLLKCCRSMLRLCPPLRYASLRVWCPPARRACPVGAVGLPRPASAAVGLPGGARRWGVPGSPGLPARSPRLSRPRLPSFYYSCLCGGVWLRRSVPSLSCRVPRCERVLVGVFAPRSLRSPPPSGGHNLCGGVSSVTASPSHLPLKGKAKVIGQKMEGLYEKACQAL